MGLGGCSSMAEQVSYTHPVLGSSPSSRTVMNLKTGIKISLMGTTVEAVGIFLDFLHHPQIGIKTPEGLLTFNHSLIFIGFIINFLGVLMTLKSRIK